MHTLSKWLAAILLALAAAGLLAAALAVEGAPRVAARDDVSTDDIDHAVAMVRMHDPRRAVPGQLQALPLRERDIDLLLHHAARRWLGADTQVQLEPGSMTVTASVPAVSGRWLNIELKLRQTATVPEIERLRVGRLPVPIWLARQALRMVAAHRGLQLDALLPLDYVEHMTMAHGQATLSYRPGRGTAERLRAALVSPADQQRLRAYQERLAALSQQVRGPEVSLASLLQPMFALAAARSAGSGDAVAENRAALLTLGLFANQRPLGLAVPAANDWPRPRPLIVTLQTRQDFALHFLVSAVIAAEAGTPLADAVGLWKELADARRGGSGFSFNDLAADRAGTRFGELATREPRRLQTAMTAGSTEADFMPRVSDLPEFLPEAEFIARFGGVDGDGYRRMLADIEARIDALPLWQ
jgi:alkylhydroperoxidase family enzyme